MKKFYSLKSGNFESTLKELEAPWVPRKGCSGEMTLIVSVRPSASVTNFTVFLYQAHEGLPEKSMFFLTCSQPGTKRSVAP